MKLLAQAARFDAHDRIGHRVEGLRSPEHLKCDAIAFESFGTPGKGLVNEILQESLAATRLKEQVTGQDTIKLLPDKHPVAFAEVIARLQDHRLSPQLKASAKPVGVQMIL
jgi:hypothetical protein